MTEPHEFTPTQNEGWMGRFSDALSRIAVDTEAMRWQRLPAACTAIVLTLTGCAPVVAATPKPSVSAGTATPEMTPSPTPEATIPATTPGLPTPESPTTQPTPDETTKAPTSSPTAETPQKVVAYSKEANKVLKTKDMSKLHDLSSHTREIFVAEVIANYYDELTTAIENDEKIPQDLRDHWQDSLICKQETVCTDGEHRGNISGYETAEQLVRAIQAERLIAFKLRGIADLKTALYFRTAIDWYDKDIIESPDEDIDYGYPMLQRDLYQIRHGVKYPSWLEAVEPEDGEHETYTCRNLAYAPGEHVHDAYIPQLQRAFLVKNTGKNIKGKKYKPFYMTVGLLWPEDLAKDPPGKFYIIEQSNLNPELNMKYDKITENGEDTCVYTP